jgi:signal transduction histidine kinase
MVEVCDTSRGRLSAWVLALGDPCDPADLPEEVRGRVRAQQVLAIQRMTPALTVANIVNACALVLVQQFSGQLSPAAAFWALLVVSLSLYTFLVAQRRRSAPFPASMRQETCNKVVRNAALFGLLWAIPGVHLLPATGGMAQGFVAALLTGMICGGALALHPIPAAAIVFMVPVTAGGLLGVARTGDPALIGFVLIALSFFLVVARNILRHSEVFVSEFVGKLELEEKNRLVAQLLDETRPVANSAANDEKLHSDRRLTEAQKMDAIGQLTGGVAHDFNNLLAAIQGHAELVQVEGKADPALVAPILGAAERGSAMVRRLLSVARKQALKPEAVNVVRLVSGMTPMLQDTLGADIQIETRIEGGMWHATADPAELECAILNLALNARDAMPEGGRLLLECGNAAAATDAAPGIGAGEFVQIAVRDTGRGMTPEVRERALDPFFTTKGRGEGAGLGLSTASGFIDQSGGHMTIESELGAGTTVRLYLPRSAALSAPILPATASAARPGGEAVAVQ